MLHSSDGPPAPSSTWLAPIVDDDGLEAGWHVSITMFKWYVIQCKWYIYAKVMKYLITRDWLIDSQKLDLTSVEFILVCVLRGMLILRDIIDKFLLHLSDLNFWPNIFSTSYLSVSVAVVSPCTMLCMFFMTKSPSSPPANSPIVASNSVLTYCCSSDVF